MVKTEDINYRYYDLKEELVDDEYKLDPDELTVNCKIFFQDLQAKFKNKFGPISFQEIADWGQKRGHGYPAIVQWMRMLWRAGLVRRYYKGLWTNAVVQKQVTGTKWGVHYSWD